MRRLYGNLISNPKYKDIFRSKIFRFLFIACGFPLIVAITLGLIERVEKMTESSGLAAPEFNLFSFDSEIGVPLISLSLFLFCAIIFGKKAYQGIVHRRVRIIPQSKVGYRSEAAHIGGKVSDYATGRGAFIVGIIYLMAYLGSMGMVVKFLLLLLDSQLKK